MQQKANKQNTLWNIFNSFWNACYKTKILQTYEQLLHVPLFILKYICKYSDMIIMDNA